MPDPIRRHRRPARPRPGRGLRARPAARGVLETLADSFGPVPRVLLRDTEPATRALWSSPPPPRSPTPPSRYQLFGEIARGGMGAVLKGRDTDLGRDLAVKVLLEQHRDNARARPPVRRGGADRRPAPAPGDRAGLRAGHASPTAGPTSP